MNHKEPSENSTPEMLLGVEQQQMKSLQDADLDDIDSTTDDMEDEGQNMTANLASHLSSSNAVFVEDDKRKRRAIANSNERRRMQSINAGFQTLKSLIPHSSGEKLSKVINFLICYKINFIFPFQLNFSFLRQFFIAFEGCLFIQALKLYLTFILMLK